MMPLDDLLVDLFEALTPGALSADAPVTIAVTSADVDLPVESSLSADGRCLASVPRGLIKTGFDPPHGRLVVHIEALS